MQKSFFIFLFVILAVGVSAQNDSTLKRSNGKLSFEIASNNVYNGRKDSVTTPYFTPAIGYFDKSGFYIQGSFSYLLRSGSGRIDVFSLDAGYEFSAGKLEGGIYAEKPFYNQNSTNVKSEVKASLSARAAYDFSVIKLFLEPGINFNKQSDFILSGGAEHEFNPNDGPFSITPTVLFNGSTLNFYQSYFDQRKYKNLRKNNPNAKVKATLLNATSFSILDYEFSLPLEYNTGKFNFSLTPYYTIPLNPAQVTVTITPNVGPIRSTTFTEKISNTFFVVIGMEYKF
jgi:hypothetical protein